MKDKVTPEVKAEMVRLYKEYVEAGGKIVVCEAAKAQGVR
jgi:hypothetical protein